MECKGSSTYLNNPPPAADAPYSGVIVPTCRTFETKRSTADNPR